MVKNEQNKKLETLPKNTISEIVNGINSIGEMDIAVNVAQKRLKPNEEFVFMFLDKFYNLIEDEIITKQDIRVLIAYAKRMLYGNQISISQQDIAEELNIDKSKVSKSVAKLTKHGVFYKESRSLYMNWKFLAKGNLTDFIKADQDKLFKSQQVLTDDKRPC